MSDDVRKYLIAWVCFTIVAVAVASCSAVEAVYNPGKPIVSVTAK